MLGGKIEVDTFKLAPPGKSTTVMKDYIVTEEDLKSDKLVNIATATGTPPGHDPKDLESPGKPVDEDREEIDVDVTSIGKVLPKTATQTYSIVLLGLVLIALGMTFAYTRRRKQA